MENSRRIPCLLSLSIYLSILCFFAFTPPPKKTGKLRKPKSEKTAFKKLAGLGVSITMGLSGFTGLSGFPTLTSAGFFWRKQESRIEKPE